MNQQKIAKHFGISQSTVSIALNSPGSTRLSSRLRREILKYCRENAPEYLNTRRTYKIAYAAWNDYCDSRFYFPLFSGVQNAAEKMDYMMIFEPAEKLLSKSNSLKLDGVINSQHTEDELIDFSPVPTVLVNNCVKDCSCDAVMPDNHAAIELAFAHLYHTGHRRIAYIDSRIRENKRSSVHVFERLEAFARCCGRYGVSCDYIRKLIFRQNEIGSSVSELVESFPRDKMPDSVICNDMLVLPLIQALALKSMTIPEDMSVVGFDNRDNDSITPFLTSVDFNFFEMGKAAFDLLNKRIILPGIPHMRINIEPKLIIRKSVEKRSLK